MNITDLKCNRIVNPLGFAMTRPRLSWITETEQATVQLACRVQVASDESFRHLLHDSGRREDIDSLGYEPDLRLTPRTRYFWRVQVWSDLGDAISPPAWFETAKMDEPWAGQWITPDLGPEIHPILRRSFTLAGDIAEARLYISGLGLYEAEINGVKVGGEVLTPYCNSYNNWIQYQTFDVTALLAEGGNAIGAMLGNGWYKGRFGFTGKPGGNYGDRFALVCELVVRFADGTEQRIVTDEGWKAAPSHILESSIYDGEVQDAGRFSAGWSAFGTDDAGWSGVRLAGIDPGLLEARRSLPVVIKETLAPVQVLHTTNGETVLDLGQNMVGWLRFKVHAPAGQRIYLQYGEEMQNGCFYRENLRTAKAEFTYISNGQPAEVEPLFTFYGFRYVKVEGWPGEVRAEDFTGCVVYSDLEQTGHIETSDPKLNRLFLNALWGQKGNFLDVPTDCPQRDERMGWTGDAQVFSGTACFNMDADAFYHKFMYDLAKEQAWIGGGIVPHFVPTFGMAPKQGIGFDSGGSCAWSEAATVIPWNLYLHYGDTAILEQQLDSMKDYVDFIRRQDDGGRLWNTGFHFGDWLALDGQGDFAVYGGTPTDLIATAYYAYSAGLAAKAAKVLGKNELAAEYAQLAAEVKEAFCAEFVSPRGRLCADTQTSYVLALFMDLVPESFRPRIVESLRGNLERNNYYLKTGFVGTPYLCRVLSENGHNDLAYRLLLNEEFPSWLYAVNLGATTIWERWNSLLPDGSFGDLGMNSLNHYTYGSIVEWMYRNMCGLQPLEQSPGFRRIRLAPQPDARLGYAKASIKTAAGLYESAWRYAEDGLGLHYDFRIPFNAQAELELPSEAANVRINGKALADCGLEYSGQDGRVRILLRAGRYEVAHPVNG
ncbi:alpha-L-rhamnosidase [Paenibacillus sp. NFR01]|uniref:alpha-L-rhamnosidase n=1 Tax=Paenibacillus sp. NFR01 TaxID=1566279 RepID=UPI0008D2D4C2|nr:alpha-L-rhamnosidase [Paenibacillus sp. NFR01]SEU26146.1 alpha-L-rhamnosidase [Paenibacillus sp. NFR01]